MFDWRKQIHNNDPNDSTMQYAFWQWVQKNSKYVSDWEEVVLNRCRGKEVLDIGAIAHNKEYIKSPMWKHRRIKRVCSSIVGLDILRDMVEWINARGYEFVCADATSNVNLNRKFDVVVMGDLIEHVDNMKGLLDFGKRHLKDGGSILISTPNPYFYHTIFGFLSEKGPRDNMEHTCWVTPSNMNEMCCREHLQLKKIYYVGHRKWEVLVKRFHFPMIYLTHTYIYELVCEEQ